MEHVTNLHTIIMDGHANLCTVSVLLHMPSNRACVLVWGCEEVRSFVSVHMEVTTCLP